MRVFNNLGNNPLFNKIELHLPSGGCGFLNAELLAANGHSCLAKGRIVIDVLTVQVLPCFNKWQSANASA